MPIASGLSMQVGFAEESTWGTRVAPTRYLEVRSEGMQLTREVLESEGLRNTASGFPRADRFLLHQRAAEGDFEAEVVSKGFGLLFKHFLGASSIFTPTGGTLSRVIRSTPADLGGKSTSWQVGKPDVAGTVRPFDYPGCKVTQWEISADVGSQLLTTWTLNGTDEITNQTLGTPSYASAVEALTYIGGSVLVGGTVSIPGALPVTLTAPTDITINVSSFSVSRDNGLATDRWRLGSALKKEPIQRALNPATGTVSLEFNTLSDYNRFANGGTYPLLFKCEGSTIEGAFKNAVYILCPVVRFDGATPTVGGPDLLTMDMDFTVLDDGVNTPLVIDYVTTDTAA